MALRVVGGLKLGFPQTQFPVINDEKPKSHKLKLGSGSNRHSLKLGLCCGSSSKSKSNFTELESLKITHEYKEIDDAVIFLLERSYDFASYLFFGHSRRQSLALAVRLPDDNGPVQQKINQITKDMDPFTVTRFVFDEVLPCLVDNASDWISSGLLVSANHNESKQKLARYCSDPYIIYPCVKPIPVNADASHIRCVEVVVDFAFILDVIHYNMEGISTREDLILFLRQLKSLVKNIFGVAAATYVPALLAKEKMETYSHIQL